MKVLKFDEASGGREGWLNARLGKLTGSRARDVITLKGDSIKADAYNLVAERLIGSAALVEDESAMERGTRLEPEAIDRFTKETGKKVSKELVLWLRDDDESIAVSPDGVIGKGSTEAVEVKCLSAGRHIEARVTGKIPNGATGYMEQARQYFVVNDKLKKLYFVFYDPRFPAPLDYFCIVVKRKDVQKEVEEWLEMERNVLNWVRNTVNNLTF